MKEGMNNVSMLSAKVFVRDREMTLQVTNQAMSLCVSLVSLREERCGKDGE